MHGRSLPRALYSNARLPPRPLLFFLGASVPPGADRMAHVPHLPFPCADGGAGLPGVWARGATVSRDGRDRVAIAGCGTAGWRRGKALQPTRKLRSRVRAGHAALGRIRPAGPQPGTQNDPSGVAASPSVRLVAVIASSLDRSRERIAPDGDERRGLLNRKATLKNGCCPGFRARGWEVGGSVGLRVDSGTPAKPQKVAPTPLLSQETSQMFQSRECC